MVEELVFDPLIHLYMNGPGDVDEDGPVTYGAAVINTLKDSIIIPTVIVHLGIRVKYRGGVNDLFVRLLKDGEEIDSFLITLSIDTDYFIPPRHAYTVTTGIGTPHLSGAEGGHEYSIEYSIDMTGNFNNRIELKIQKQVISLLELRR